MILLSCGMGVGLGMVLDGKLYTGHSGSAGEIARSHVFGQRPFRAQVEINALLDRVRQQAPPVTRAAVEPIEKLDFSSVVALWKKQDPFIRQCVEDVSVLLGEMAALALSVLNCERVVFGGDYLVFEQQILPVLNQVVQQQAFDPVRVLPSTLRQDAGLQGLISMAADVLLEQIAMERM